MRARRILLSLLLAAAASHQAMAGNGSVAESFNADPGELARFPGGFAVGTDDRRSFNDRSFDNRHFYDGRRDDGGHRSGDWAPSTSYDGSFDRNAYDHPQRRFRNVSRSVSVVQINNGVNELINNGVIGLPRSFQVLPGGTGPKIIDVDSARLDRRPYGKNGLDIVYSGTTKIIRISPDFPRGRAAEKDDVHLGRAEGAVEFAKLSPAERAVTVYPDPDEPVEGPAASHAAAALPQAGRIPVPSPAPEEARLAARSATPAPTGPAAPQRSTAATSAGFEPWTEEWLRDCVARYPSFDASLGTYTDEATGRRRFCTGDPAN